MSRVTQIKTNWTAGELAKDLFGRVDITKYANGAETLENFIVQPHGGITRRPGTRFVKEVKTSSAKTRLVPFEFSTTQSSAICMSSSTKTTVQSLRPTKPLAERHRPILVW